MEKKTAQKKASVVETGSAETEWTTEKLVSYIRYLYNQNERLWQQIEAFGGEMNEVKAALRGEY